ncbi:NACHT, LRR and PYD domains-containing protein 1 homolog [Hoplias malabaricus]|uniref:NACHT, LRR and PYD domains-containing protein 1 homolog n=1 Tax=Hoplias malabaricus TaxID=27720 RepID=UPI003462F238
MDDALLKCVFRVQKLSGPRERKTDMAKQIENAPGAWNLDLDIQPGSDDMQMTGLQSEHGQMLSLRNKEGILTPLYKALGSKISSFTNLLTQSEVSTVLAIGSRNLCKSCSTLEQSAAQEWQIIEPEALSTLATENQKYRITAAPGSYECRVTGLRWESADKVQLEYHLSDWEILKEFLETKHIQPCGPLLDVTVFSGNLTAAHLPHFLCLGSSPSLRDAVSVLHVEDDIGVSLESCELSCFGAKLLHPTFSPKGVLVKSGFPVKAHCDVLIYCTSTAHLTLHVYLLPCDSKMIESVQKKEYGSVRIYKPRPDISLQMKNHYILSTTCPSQITPEKLKLRYTNQTPNFFEVYIKDAKNDFQLLLMTEEKQSIWGVNIRSDEYNQKLSSFDKFSTAPQSSDIHFVDLHRKSLVQRVNLVEPIADGLYPHISKEKHSQISSAKTSQDKMRLIYDLVLSGGPTLKDVFLQSLQENEPDLIRDLCLSNK